VTGGLSVLLLGDDSRSHAPNVLEHIRALQRFSRHRVDFFNPVGLRRSRILRFDSYDVVVVHFTLVVLSDDYLAPWFREQLAAFDGLKVQFIQDEYRQVDAVAERVRELGIDLLFSSVPADAVARVYGSRLPGVDVASTLTGYVPAELESRARPPLEGRPLDVVYRGRAVPFWLGRLGQDKVLIGQEFLAHAAATDLRCDIAWTEAERIYGDEWYRFLASSRTTLGTESGASVIDFEGSLQKRTERYLESRPGATFDEVEREILAPYEGNVVIQTVSPRVFEAAALGTVMVNFSGRYSDTIEPWVHYVPLEKDFSNFDDVLASIEDDAVLEPIAARAHTDLVASGRYSLQTFVREFERELEARVRRVQDRPRPRRIAGLKRELLGLEQLQSRERRAELRFVASLNARALERVETRLLRRFPEIENLAQRQRKPPQDKRLHRDLVRVALAAAAHLRELRYAGPAFDIRVEFDGESGRLMLIGTRERPQDPSELDRLREEVAAAIRSGRLQEIVWDNSAAGASLTFLTLPISSLEIGYHVVIGAHRLSALVEVARDDPDAVIAALNPLFRERPAEPVRELDPRILVLLRVLDSPRATAELWTQTVRTGLGSKDLRRLLRAYLGSSAARAEAPVHVLLKDFFRLKLIAESPTGIALERDGETLVFRTTSGNGARETADLDAATVLSLERIVWDHSAVGSSVTWRSHPRISVSLDRGMHEFEALTPLARRFPELTALALNWAARGE
jgi:hypothetical protein